MWSAFRFSKQDEDLLDLLAGVPIFEGFSRNNLKLVLRMLHSRQYKKGEAVFTEGEPGAGMYIIISGEVEITRKFNHGELSLAVVREHGFFGELALLDEMPRGASARAAAETVIFGFTRPSLESLCGRNPRLGIKVLLNLSRLVCRRLVKSNDALELMQNRLGVETKEPGNREGAAVHV